MKIYQFFHAVMDKFIPLDESSKSELHTEAVNFYNSNLEKAREIDKYNHQIKEYNLSHVEDENYIEKRPMAKPLSVKIISFLNTWWVRYIIAAAFIFAIPKIKSFIYSDKEKDDDFDDEEDDDDDDIDDYEDYKRYLKFKRQMR